MSDPHNSQAWFPVRQYEKATAGYAVYYVSYTVLNGIFVFVLFTLLMWPILMTFIWKLLRDFLYTWPHIWCSARVCIHSL